MNTQELSQDELKAALKQALIETLAENRELFQEMVSEALDDFIHGQIVNERDGLKRSKEGFPIIEGRA